MIPLKPGGARTISGPQQRVLASLERFVLPGLGCFLAFLASAADPETPHLWHPVRDDVYLQEIGRKVLSDEPLNTVAVFAQKVYVGSGKGLYRLNDDKLEPVREMREPVRRLVTTRDALWAMTGRGLYRLQGGTWKKISDEPVADVTGHLSEVIAASGARLWRVHGDQIEALSTNEAPFAINRVISHCETLYVQGGDRLTFVNGQGFGGLDVYSFAADQGWDWGDLPSRTVRDALSLGKELYLATDRGLGVWRGMVLASIRGEQGLCYEDTTCLARGFTNDLWIGTIRGAIRMTNGRFHYFAGQRWLPADRVNAIAADERTVYIATPDGLGIIEYEPYTLSKKAAYYERHLEEWGQKRLGFTHKLEWDDGLKQYVREISDNDGGYSGDYLAAQSYRYAVTKDPEAHKEAVNTFQALRWLEAMTGIPGFPARAVWVKGSSDHKSMSGSGGLPAEWHDTADGRFEWKGDTSSDEICSHFYATTLFLELAAQGEEKEQARQHLAKIAAHLLDHHWQLIDFDGKPTRWGRWDPEYFATDEGRTDRGLQALEILSFMKTAATLTGDAKFAAAYQKLVEMGYPEYTVRQRNTPPPPENISHFEDQLALWCYWNLLRFEKDPQLRSIYRRSLERSYEVIRVEQNPWYNFVYGALTGNDCEVGPAANHLRGWPLDLVVWSYQNSHRADLRTPAGYVALNGGSRTFLPRETEPLRWDHWLMQADGGTGGRDVAEPSGWLLAYWMGRYHGFIEAPTVTDPKLLVVERGRTRALAVTPYSGPPRPVGF
ncbi:MAG TPA: hypothetical protein VN887_05290 [Candidatus Angelobacter sp.]|nr:hypothetical protein [Candidatus Angelobacter sp.]